MPLKQADAHTGRHENPWDVRARYFNSGNAFALNLSQVPNVQFVAERDRAFAPDAATGFVEMDLSDALETPYPATTPLVMSRYARVNAGESLQVDVRASVQLLCVLTGRGTTKVGEDTVQWQAGDVLALPGAAAAEHHADETAVAWLVTDEPALAFLDLAPVDAGTTALQPVHYHAEDLRTELDRVYQHPEAENFPGFAVVLSQTGLEHTRNIHPTMTLALNSLPAGRSQRPHVHSAMALTLCLQGEGVYSLVDGERKDWKQHAVMVTPPGAPHSHHNEGDKRMESWVIQDGGLHYYARTTGFAFVD